MLVKKGESMRTHYICCLMKVDGINIINSYMQANTASPLLHDS